MSFDCKNLSCPTLTKNCWILILAILQIGGIGLNYASIFGYPGTSISYWVLYEVTRIAGMVLFAASCVLSICLPCNRICFLILFPIEILIQMFSLVMFLILWDPNQYGALTAAGCRIVLIVVEICLINSKKLSE